MLSRSSIIVLAAIAVIPMLMLVNFVFHVLGYSTAYSEYEATELAEKFVEEGRSVHDCLKIKTFFPTYPSLGSFRATCIREYAKITKDPSVCELLMPSSYGLYCVGAAEESLPCDVESTAYSVYWRDGNMEHTEDIRSCMNPNKNRSQLGNQCCLVAQVAWLIDKNDCSALKSNIPVYDHCLYALAWKLKDPHHCNGMTSENPRSACLVQTKALQKDPSMCSGCTSPIESLEVHSL